MNWILEIMMRFQTFILAFAILLDAGVSLGGVTPLKPKAAQNLRYGFSFNPTDGESVVNLLMPALELIREAAPQDFVIREADGGGRPEFTIHITTYEQVKFEMNTTLGLLAASQEVSYTLPASEPGRYIVRLLWDRLTTHKEIDGTLVGHPRALVNVTRALAREIYGTVRTSLMNQSAIPLGREVNSLVWTASMRDRYRASAQALERLVRSPRFRVLMATQKIRDEQQKQLRDAVGIEWESVENWERLIETKQFRNGRESAQLLDFEEAACRGLFRIQK